MSLLRYFSEQGEEHGGRLHWSGTFGGLPFRGDSAPLLTQAELEEKTDVTVDFHCRQFDLTDPAQKADYEEVMSRIANGWYVLQHCDRSQPMIRVVEWLQRYYEASPAAKDAIRSAISYPNGTNGNGNGRH